MTTFSYTIHINDSQRLALERALQIAINHCDEEIKRGEKCPNISIKSGCVEIWQKLSEAKPRQTSSYTPPQTLADIHGGVTDLVRGSKAKKVKSK